MAIKITVNGKLRSTEAAADTPLLYVLRDDFELRGAKFGCGLSQCGACSVLVDGNETRSCVTPIERPSRTETGLVAVDEHGAARRTARDRSRTSRHATRSRRAARRAAEYRQRPPSSEASRSP